MGLDVQRQAVHAHGIVEPADGALQVGVHEVAIDPRNHAPRLGADQFEFGLQTDLLRGIEVADNAHVVIDGIVPYLEFLRQQAIAHGSNARLAQHPRRQREAPRFVHPGRGLIGLHEARQRHQLDEVP